MMEVSRVTNEILTERLDAEFYRPIFLSNARQLLNVKNLVTLEEASTNIKLGYTGKIEKYYANEGALFLSSKNLVDGQVVIGDNTDRISISAHKGVLKSTQVYPGDILFSRTGSVGKCAVLYDQQEQYNIAAHLIAIRLKAKYDTEYIATFFNTKFGQLQTLRLQRGFIIQGLSIYDLPSLTIPIYSESVQTYIGDKVRLAERLRERSQKIETEVKQFFSIPYWNEEKVGMYRSYRTKSAIIHPERLDTAFYDPAHINLEEVLYRTRAIPLSKLASQVKKSWNKGSHLFYYLEIGEINLGNGSITPKMLFTKDAPSRAKLLVKPWDVLVSTVRPNRKNIALVPDVYLDIPIVASTGFSVLRFKSKAETVFYHCWLRSDAATQQLMRWNAGASYPAIDDDIAISTLVPQYPDKIVEEQGKRWLIKFIGEDLSICLTTAAKLLVEALIEGKLTEDELKTAQEALQKGDREPDKAILSRLTRKGYDIKDEPPLFPDLDLLYQTIDQLNADEQGE